MIYRPVHLIPPNTRIDFMRWHKLTFAFSLALVLGSFVLIFVKGMFLPSKFFQEVWKLGL